MSKCHLTWIKTHKNDLEKKGEKRGVQLGVGTTRRRVRPPFLKIWKNLVSRDVSSEQLLFVIVVYLCSFAENDLKILFLDPPPFSRGGGKVAEWDQPPKNDEIKI